MTQIQIREEDEGPRPIRVCVFKSDPDTILIVAPGARESLVLPSLPMPFTTGGVAEAFGIARIEARVSETVAGRWTSAMAKTRRDDRAERAQRHHLEEAAEALLLRNSSNPLYADRAATLARKHEADAEIARLKLKISDAKRQAYLTHEYQPRSIFLGWERDLARTKQESQALQVRLGELRDQERAENARKAEERSAAGLSLSTSSIRRRSAAARFRMVAHDVLDPDVFGRIVALAEELRVSEGDDGEEDDLLDDDDDAECGGAT